MFIQTPLPGNEKEEATVEEEKEEKGVDVHSNEKEKAEVFEEIEQRLAELELQTDEGFVSMRTTTTTVTKTSSGRPLSPRKKGFSFDSPFPSPIDVENTKQLNEKALKSFDSKYQQEVNSAAVPPEKRAEQYPQLTKGIPTNTGEYCAHCFFVYIAEYVDDIRAAMQGITLSLPPLVHANLVTSPCANTLTQEAKKDEGWQKLLAKTKKGGL